MILYPAIDLKDGQAVRLLRGEMDQATVFSDSPADQAKAFREAGFTHLHVVDLNGAFAGKPVNRAAIDAILGAVDVPVQHSHSGSYLIGWVLIDHRIHRAADEVLAALTGQFVANEY